MNIHNCLIFLNDLFILIDCLPDNEDWKWIDCRVLISFKSVLIMHFVKNFVNKFSFVWWKNIKFVIELDFDDFSVIFELDLHLIFFRNVDHSISIRLYVWMFVHDFIKTVRFDIDWMINIFEEYWMQIKLKNNWEIIEVKLNHRFYVFFTK